ncbi:acetylornithine transaminase [Chryseomicrobium palamuruense]|uniref:Acetylornithine aminotransferase n=1 Tax=Chryseomicrobium palamuruense TaxID=682973 RepID=A0ABV8USD4_9BACL
MPETQTKSHLFPNYARRPIELVKGQGTKVWDAEGNEYLDFIAGIAVLALGHAHPKVNETLNHQSEQIWHVSNLFESSGQEKLAALLTADTHFEHAFFCNSGAEANEAAIKLARRHTGKHHIVTFTNSFHGRTFGAMSATGQEKVQQGFGPLVSRFTHVPFNDPDALKGAVSDETAAIMLEIVQGEGGVNPVTDEFAETIQSLCDEHGLLLIIDEVQTGIGRTGTRYAYEQTVLKPDIITLAKGLGGGFPIGGMLGTAALGTSLGPGSHGTTYGGNALAVAVSNTVVSTVFEPDFLRDVEEKADYLALQLAGHYEVRGLGLLMGLVVEDSAAFATDMQSKGLLVVPAGPNVVRLLPPLNVSYEELDAAIEILLN